MSATKRKYKKSDKELQLLVLQEILAQKDLLFGKFMGTTTTKTDITDGWKTVARLAISYGLIPANSDEEKFKRTTWQNWRSTSLTKVDRMKKTGVGGATFKDLLDENDKVVLAIVGDEIAYGIGATESDGERVTNINKPSPSPNNILQPNEMQPFSSSRQKQRSFLTELKGQNFSESEKLKNDFFKNKLLSQTIGMSRD